MDALFLGHFRLSWTLPPLIYARKKGTGLDSVDLVSSPGFYYSVLTCFETLSNWLSISLSIKMEIKDLSHWLDRSLGNENEKSYKIIMCYVVKQAGFMLLKRYLLPPSVPYTHLLLSSSPHRQSLPFPPSKQPSPDWLPSPLFHWNWSDKGHQSLPCYKDLVDIFSQHLLRHLSITDHFLETLFSKFRLCSSTLLVFHQPIWWFLNLLC